MSKKENAAPVATTEGKAAPVEAPAKPKTTVMKSEGLLALAEPLFKDAPAVATLCGVNEIKLKLSQTDRNMSCYIRHTRGGFLLQLPNNKLEQIVGTDLKEFRTRETQRQTVYTFPDMESLATNFNKAARKAGVAAPVIPKPKKPKAAKADAKAAPAKGDAPVT